MIILITPTWSNLEGAQFLFHDLPSLLIQIIIWLWLKVQQAIKKHNAFDLKMDFVAELTYKN